MRRFLALCLLFARRPSALHAVAIEPDGSAPDGGAVGSGEEAARGRSGDPTLRGRSGDPTPSGLAASAPTRALGRDEPRAGSLVATKAGPTSKAPADGASAAVLGKGSEHHVHCGGLLFLVKRIAASPLVDRQDGLLENRLVALGWTALHRALDPLPEAARRAAFERERPVLAVFAGTTELPDDLLAEPRGAASRDAGLALDALAAALPPDLEAYADGVRATYGSPAPFDPSYPHRALAHLLLRAGRLRMTRTHADLHLPVRAVSLALRVGGWDIDPGWVPYLGRVVRFHYDEQ